MPITARKAVAVIYFHHVAVTALASCNRHTASGGRADRLSRVSAQVDASMNCGPAIERIHTHTERRTHVDLSDDRLAHWHCDQCMRVTVDLCTGHVDTIELTFEGAGACLWRSDWNEWPADRPVVSRPDQIDP